MINNENNSIENNINNTSNKDESENIDTIITGDVEEIDDIQDIDYVNISSANNVIKDDAELKTDFDTNDCGNLENQFSKEFNKFLLKKELM